jgi:hypothetical protein
MLQIWDESGEISLGPPSFTPSRYACSPSRSDAASSPRSPLSSRAPPPARGQTLRHPKPPPSSSPSLPLGRAGAERGSSNPRSGLISSSFDGKQALVLFFPVLCFRE